MAEAGASSAMGVARLVRAIVGRVRGAAIMAKLLSRN